MASIDQVVGTGLCVGCGACAVVAGDGILIRPNEWGGYEAELSQATEAQRNAGSRVCPWADESDDETEVAARLFPSSEHSDDLIGSYLSVSAGQVGSEEEITQSSSGGLTSWTAIELLSRGLVDGVIHVGSSSGSGELFEYQVSDSVDEVRGRRKSQYYATHFDGVLNEIRGNGQRYAFVGVPCFVKAARAACAEDPVLGDQITFFLGLVCGHLKTRAFAELLAWQTGVPPERLETVDFRLKNPAKSASKYDFGAAPVGGDMVRRPTHELIGGSWGHGMFQLEACNYCDDIFAETADVVFGDAWLPQFEADWRGTNLVIARHPTIQQLFEEASASKRIQLQAISVVQARQSQAGNYRHRRIGLAVRLADDLKSGRWVPTKRVEPGYSDADQRRVKIIRLRREISRVSHERFAHARKNGTLSSFLTEMGPLLDEYSAANREPFVRRLRLALSRRIRFYRRRWLG